MSEFRLWIHGKISRLDGTRERRFVALSATLIFATLALGPQALRAVDDVVNAPDIRVDALGADQPSDQVRFQASSSTDPAETGPTRIVEILQLFAWPGTEPRIEVTGTHAGFDADSAFFRVQSITGLAFLGEYPAERDEGDGWHALFAVPGGSLYKVTLVAREAGVGHESYTKEVAVPVADAPIAAAGPTLTIPPPTFVSLLLPNIGSELMSPVLIAARISNATATSVTFEVLDPAGVTRNLRAGAGTAGEWTAMFVGEAGRYGVSARAVLNDGSVVSPDDFRSFRILAAATDIQTPIVGTEPPSATTEASFEPIIELFSPLPDSAPFSAAVPLSARVRNGLPEKLVAIVTGPAGDETIIIASKTPTGDYWNAIFEGPDGEYRFRMRALVDGKQVFSPERRFTIKRVAG